MNTLQSNLYCLELENSIKHFKEINCLKNKSFLITGSTGLICSAIVDLIIYINKKMNFNIKLYLAGRSKLGITDRFGKEFFIEYIHYDAINEYFNFNNSVDYIIHGASIADPDKYTNNPVDTIYTGLNGLKAILEYSKKFSTHSKIIYISSSEVYGNIFGSKYNIENNYGNIDLLNPRNSYSNMKRMSENLCISYNTQYNLNCTIVRPGHIYGPTLKITDKRISSKFIVDAINKKNIVLKSSGTQYRSYINTIDCALAILTTLIKGNRGEAYNIASNNSNYSIKEFSEMLSELSHVKLLFDNPDKELINIFNPMNSSALDCEKIYSLGWKPIYNLRNGLNMTINVLKEIYKNSNIDFQ